MKNITNINIWAIYNLKSDNIIIYIANNSKIKKFYKITTREKF